MRPDCPLFSSSGSNDKRVSTPTYLPCKDKEHPDMKEAERLLEAIYDGIAVPARFSPTLFKYFLGYKPNLHDLAGFSPELGLSFVSCQWMGWIIYSYI